VAECCVASDRSTLASTICHRELSRLRYQSVVGHDTFDGPTGGGLRTLSFLSGQEASPCMRFFRPKRSTRTSESKTEETQSSHPEWQKLAFRPQSQGRRSRKADITRPSRDSMQLRAYNGLRDRMDGFDEFAQRSNSIGIDASRGPKIPSARDPPKGRPGTREMTAPQVAAIRRS